jgi:hypothetical protein
MAANFVALKKPAVSPAAGKISMMVSAQGYRI